MPSLPPFIFYGFIALVGVVFLAFVLVLENARRKGQLSVATVGIPTIGIAVWLGISAGLTWSGVFQDWNSIPPRFPLLILIPFVLMVFWLRSKKCRQLLHHIPQHHLILLQVFRLPVELFLLAVFLNGVIPERMTFEGFNFDVASAILAIPVGWLVRKKRASHSLIRFYNYLGILLVTTIVIIAILSTPTPLRVFTDGPPNTFIVWFPYSWLPAFLVAMAYLLHFMSLKKLNMR